MCHEILTYLHNVMSRINSNVIQTVYMNFIISWEGVQTPRILISSPNENSAKMETNDVRGAPSPTSFTANTLKSYLCPRSRFLAIARVSFGCTLLATLVHRSESSVFFSSTNLSTGRPPSLLGCFHWSVTWSGEESTASNGPSGAAGGPGKYYIPVCDFWEWQS